MERLTELKAGQELPVEVIKAWAGYTDISAHPKMRKVTSVGIDYFEFRNAVDNGNYGKAPKLAGFIEFYNKFYNLDNQPIKGVRPKIDFRNLSDVYFKVPDMQTQHKLLDKLFELGYLHGGLNSFEPTILYPIWEVRVGNAIGGRQELSDPKYTLMDYNLLLNAQLTNTNNTPLNTKTDGNKIIVCKPHPRITNGQRPEGSSVSGKTSRAKVSSGHLSYRTISS